MSELKQVIIEGITLGQPMDLELGEIKRPVVYETVYPKCPYCDTSLWNIDLSDGDPLEYGSFYLPEECDECGEDFAPSEFEVTATLTITRKV